MKINLNENQQKAVHHETGPLLVIAGAGTGKTRVITERIRFLIQERGVNADEILALTFTDKASQEMEERVGDIMPLGYTEPWISTFHSFGDRILREEGLEIGLNPSYKIISYPNQWLLLRKNLFKLDLEYFRPLGNPTKFISAALKFISRLQDENVSVSDFEEFTKNVVSPEEKPRWEELLSIYTSYEKIKLENSKLDFGDLIIWTLKLFRDRPYILKKYQDKFKHILVDEFQDTNYAQYELVKVLFPEADAAKKTPSAKKVSAAAVAADTAKKAQNDTGYKRRSLLAVGDDSQSIYKFRGAAISNIMQFREDYKGATTITLIENYRSHQKILDPAYSLIQENNPDTLEAKLGISKELISMVGEKVGKATKKPTIETSDKEPTAQTTTENNKAPPPRIILAETHTEEVNFIVKEILEILGREPTYTYKDFAILARANNHLEPIVMALRQHGIPYQLVGNRGLYDREEIRDIISLIKVIINPQDDISLYRALNIDTLAIPFETVAGVLTQSKIKKVSLWSIVQEKSTQELDSLKEKIRYFQKEMTDMTPVQFVYELVQSINYIKQFTETENIENQMCIKNLDLFLERIKRFEVAYHEETKEIATIVDFLDYLELVIEAGENPAQAEIEDVDTVNLMTVHAAKGLEFPVVFVINMISGRFPTRNRSDPIEIPEELVKELLPSGDYHVQEERRLLYVAMTRAKNYLYLTLAKNYGGKRDATPSGFLQETHIETEPYKESEASGSDKAQKQIFGVDSGFRDPANRKVDFTPKFLSYSQISMYDTCPLQYKYKYVLNVPSKPSHALSFGITIHDTLRDFHRKLLFGKVSLRELHDIYEKNWQPLGYMNEEHRQLRFEEGKKLLDRYYKQVQKEDIQPIDLEKSFNLKLDGLKFYGRIDRIDKLPDGGVEIIDYKTGKVKSQKEVDKDDQIGFYAIAAKEALGMDPKKLTYYFLEDDKRVSTTRTPEQLEKHKEKARDTVQKIKSGNFEPTPGMICNWCDYKDICPFAWRG